MTEAQEVPLELCYPHAKAREINSDAVEALMSSISESGLLSPISVRRCQKSRSGQMCDAFEIIAGMHRVKAFRRLGKETIPAFIQDFDDLHAELAMLDENLARSDLSPAERASAQARRKKIYLELHPETKHGAGTGGPGGRKKREVANLATSQAVAPRYTDAAASATGQSERAIQREVQRGEALGEDVLSKVARTSLDKGEELDALAKLPPGKRDEAVARAVAGEKISVKTLAKKEHREQREAELGGRQRALPDRKFGIIYADPEWFFEPYSTETGMDRAPDNHYPTSSVEVIKARDVPAISAPDSVLFLWATAPMIREALEVMVAWGFDYKSQVIWAKKRAGRAHGTGYWFWGEHEILLVGTRGKPPGPAPGTQWSSVVEAPVGPHSEKPAIFHELIEAYFPTLPKIELNARAGRAGWEVWGNEAPVVENQDVFPDDLNQVAPLYEETGPLSDIIDELRHNSEPRWKSQIEVAPGTITSPPTAAAAFDAVRAFDAASDMPDFLRRMPEKGGAE